MNIRSKILNSLKPLNVSVYYGTNYEATEDIYVVFFIEGITTHSIYDDEEASTKYTIMFHIYSTGDYDNYVKDMKQTLKLNGFRRITEAEDYDSETEYYTKAIKFEYVDFTA